MPRPALKTHPKSITFEQAQDIRRRWEAREATQTAMAQEHGISQSAVSAIIRGRTHTTQILAMTKEEELARRRRQRFFLKYGITYEEWQAKLDAADHRCESCGKHVDDLPPHPQSGLRSLSCDHNHRTGVVRGPLCGRCNTVLGFVDESIEKLEGLVSYLKKYGAL
jgi:plasmid maintenance system antidote protein VapI